MVPADEYDNLPAIETINAHPHLFKITTPIKVNRFDELLSDHPNQLGVKSVCFFLPTVSGHTHTQGTLTTLPHGITRTARSGHRLSLTSWKDKWTLKSPQDDTLKTSDLTSCQVCIARQSIQSPNRGRTPYTLSTTNPTEISHQTR